MFDVAIVGGGPAGSWTAATLAGAGARVALIDGSHPREKPCGGGVTGRALDLVGLSVANLEEAVPITGVRFAHRDRVVQMPLAANGAAPRLAVVPRRAFDACLLARAEQAGATILRTRAIEVTRTAAARWSVLTRTGAVAAAWLIGADGPGSLVRRRVSAPFAREDLSIAAGYYVRGIRTQEIEIAFEDAPAGYLWSFPRPDHLAVGVCAQADQTTSGKMLTRSAAWIDRHAPGAARERYSWPIPSLRAGTLAAQRPAGDGWMLTGDAAGLVDPITREGIFFALASGAHAAASLAAPEPARAYTERLRDTIYAELLLAARLKARFYRPHFMALLVSALRRSERIRGIMADLIAGEQPYHSLRRRLLATCELRLMLELFGLAGVSEGNNRPARAR